MDISNTLTFQQTKVHGLNSPPSACPFIHKRQQELRSQQPHFGYTAAFQEKIDKKHQDHSYRVFKTMNKLQPPMACHGSADSLEDALAANDPDVMVFCR